MTRCVVDTNVPVVANGKGTNASLACRRKAIDALYDILKNGRIIIDSNGYMLDEYQRYCSASGQPGLGDRFFQEILMSYSGRVERIHLDVDQNGNFADFPTDPALAAFDISDRKFAAAARKTGAVVVNATDTDWLTFAVPLRTNGVQLHFVCGENCKEWFIADA